MVHSAVVAEWESQPQVRRQGGRRESGCTPLSWRSGSLNDQVKSKVRGVTQVHSAVVAEWESQLHHPVRARQQVGACALRCRGGVGVST